MPSYQRRGLRQSLGLDYLRDMILCQTTGSTGAVGSMNIVDANQADATASGESMYQRHWLRLLGSIGVIQDVRVASFNTGSGAFYSPVALASTIFSGMPFEVHALLSPAEKDRQLDNVIRDVRYRQEVPIWAIDAGCLYSIGPEIMDIIDVRYLSDPAGSLDTGEGHMDWWKYEKTASGQQLRVTPALSYSQQLIVDAVLAVSLGASDLATVNLPDDGLVLWGASARCYWLLQQRAPGQEASEYAAKGQQAATQYTRLSARFQPMIAKKIQLDAPW